MASKQQIEKPQSLLSRLLWRGAILLAALYGFAAFVDRVVLPEDGGRITVQVEGVKESARGALADAVRRVDAKIWR